ncbi:hypothetical protein LOK49_LG12G00417 [Camellia lanceoleosa]|uniref:Uncharacterized protein n=1 Tax=Camellia lanceoleosa TaxID=1840588 RepID=A0ACC0FS23_9ERIC|nr:hypothetical protein LOK49_LG12G00417 [Camellia lanceoleosa]
MLSQCPTYFLHSRIHYSVLHVMGVFVNFSDRFLPDKAIDLVDEAGSRVRLRHAQLPEEARELDKELRQITKEKNEAVRSQDFEKVQEAASGSVFVQMLGVWINLAHVHFAQGNFPLAVKMVQYKQSSSSTFYLSIPLAPSNYTLKFDAGVAMQKFSASTLQKKKRTVDEAEDSAQVAKLRSALESLDHKRRKDDVLIAGFGRKGHAVGRYSWCQIQGREGIWCLPSGSLQGEEREAKVLVLCTEIVYFCLLVVLLEVLE